MRVSYCPLNCFPDSSLDHHSPCPLKLEDVNQVSCSPTSASVAVEKESCENEKVGEVEKNGVDEGKKVVEVARKSSLKKPAGFNAKEVEKGRVKWMDFVGKELVEIREFEPLEAREAEERISSNPTCTCVVL